MIVQWSKRAMLERQLIYQHIYEDNGAAAADRNDDRIWHSLEMLANFPALGTVTRNPAVRQRVVPGTRFLALYTTTKTQIVIKRLLHGAQQHEYRDDSL